MTGLEIERGFQEIWKLFQQTDKQFKETDAKFKETDAKFKETDAKFKETDAKFKETDKQFKETFKETGARIDKAIGALTSKWGRFVEGLIAPGAVKLFKERGIEVDSIHQRVKVHKNGADFEVDILAVNEEYVVPIEAKSTLGVEDVREYIEKIEKFKFFFPEYKGRKVVGAVAGIVIDRGADKFAYKNGLFVIAQSGETITILNDDQFRPRVW